MRICDNREVPMNEQQEMPVATNFPAPKFRYWFTPPESLTVKVTDIEPFVPKANWKVPAPAGLTVEIPADKIFSKNVPRIPLRLLAELLPDHISTSDGMVKLPSASLAAAYRLVEHVEELIPEAPPEPETPAAAEIPDGPVEELGPLQPGDTPLFIPFGPDSPELAPGLSAAPEPSPIASTAHPSEQEIAAVHSGNDPAPISGFSEPLIEPPLAIPLPVAEPTNLAPSKFPPRRTGFFVGLPIFRRKPLLAVPQPISPPPSAPPADLRPLELPRENAAQDLVLPEVPPPLPPEEPPVTAKEPVQQIEPEPFFPPPPAVPVRMLRTEHFPSQTQNQEIVEQEPLQALFLTEETMTVSRVIELCGGLPGVNSCVLAHGSVVVASHNVPDGVDLVSMSAHAADMLRAMRESSARMGVGTVPAVTLHTEKGVISFFNREDLTMLVFHRDRGFVPGVREKMAAVLGELTKARLTLPVGGDEEN